jgi:hypothetical protein
MFVTVESYLTFPDDIERKIPGGFSQNKTYQLDIKAVLMLIMPIEGRGRDLDPKQIPPRDKDIHLVEFKNCSDINPQ